MKCHYFLAPSLSSTKAITEALQQAGIKRWFIHVLSKDDAGLKRERIHASNYLERLDILRHGLIGAVVGFLAGLVVLAILAKWPVFGSDLPTAAYLGVLLVLTFFGAWEGGLIGVSRENKKIELFHDELEQGHYLLMIYTPKSQQERVLSTIKSVYSEVRLVAVDPYFYNPLAELKRLADD